MKPKILVTREVFSEALNFLGQHFDVTPNQADTPMSPEVLATALADMEGALTTLSERIDEALLAKCPKLKAVCNIAVGYNNIDLKACHARGVMATNTPGVLDDSTADFTWALILATARRVTEAEQYLRAGKWTGWKLKQFLGTDVHHATLGILGMGRVGQAVARRARGFEMTVLYHNTRRLSAEIEKSCHAAYVSMDELLARADILTVHTPYSPATHHLLGATQMAKMKSTAILINAARGGVIDDAALVAALKQGALAGAGLDVFENEPSLHPGFLKLSNVVLTPHVASSSEATRRRMAMLAAENLVAALTTGKPPNLLHPPV
ncbi:MAG: D-glycerate dehydrogenase [Gammaproteobacteria bacterium]|nr:D-glycerate dehydrogenase [Gammaproteobacteria bacterium]MDH3371640.1 D-glycerate dehydrogenase [Gammaproteobacteria bacterium]MDH3563546.1 D-glycerate dehydrogenase [Gammaproteobacteria bacterium]MDH5488243.1 D-glycerate dehydrogenase [Gammaproteobacteria bacterium]